jgi:sensor histidine kinase regulating citrate/malate metabolism
MNAGRPPMVMVKVIIVLVMVIAVVMVMFMDNLCESQISTTLQYRLTSLAASQARCTQHLW